MRRKDGNIIYEWELGMVEGWIRVRDFFYLVICFLGEGGGREERVVDGCVYRI